MLCMVYSTVVSIYKAYSTILTTIDFRLFTQEKSILLCTKSSVSTMLVLQYVAVKRTWKRQVQWIDIKGGKGINFAIFTPKRKTQVC